MAVRHSYKERIQLAVLETLETRRLLSAGLSTKASAPAGGQIERPDGNTGTGFFVSGTQVYDANGYPLTIRGFNHTAYYGDNTRNLAAIDEFRKTGANAVRANFSSFGLGGTPSGRKNVVERYLANGIVPIVEDHTATSGTTASSLQSAVDRWLLPENVSWLKQYESQIILNIANEWGPDASLWRDAYISSIARLRDAGINALLMVDAGTSGQSIHTIQTWAKDILDADPQHNVVFSIHMYGFWRTEGATDVGAWSATLGSPWDIRTELNEVRDAGIPLIVGEFGSDAHSAVGYDTRRAVEIYDSLGLGWLAWSWNQNSDSNLDMVQSRASYQYDSDADLSAFGRFVINDTSLGLKYGAIPSTAFGGGRISGTLLNNSNQGIAAATLFIDDDRDGAHDASERSTITDAAGAYAFDGLPQGLHSLAIVPSTSAPLGIESVTVALPALEQVSVNLRTKTTAEASTGSISGYAWDDTSRDGYRKSAEPTLAGRYVFLDHDGDDEADVGEPVQMTDAQGQYVFDDLEPGTYRVRVLLTPGSVLTTARLDVPVVAGESVVNVPVGMTTPPPLGSISGLVYDDDNFSTTFDTGETVVGAREVFLDLDRDGQRDTNEPRTNTASDGTFLFTRLTPGEYVVRRVASGWQTTTPISPVTVAPYTVTAAPPIGVYETRSSISGVVYQDANSNAKRDTGETTASGTTVYIDTDGDRTLDAGEPSTTTGVDGTFTLPNLRSNTLTVRAVTPTGLGLTTGAQTYALGTGESYTGMQIGIGVLRPASTPAPGSISGIYFVDANANRRLDAGETRVAGAVVFIDQNNDGLPTAGEPSVNTASDGRFAFAAVASGTVRLRTIIPGGATLLTPLIDVILSPTQHFAIARFGISQPATGSISGVAYNDNNANGVFDAGDSAISRVVFLDANNNGRADAGEKSVKSGSNGVFSFSELVPGTYRVRREFPAGYKPSNPLRDYTLVGGDAITGADIGSVTSGTVITPPGGDPPPADYGSISGVLYNDNNTNGVFDAGDSPIGRVVYLDTNNNGKRDTGEKSMTSGSDGKFTFANLVAGTYYVRREFPTGYKASNPPRDYTLVAGQSITGADIGSVKTSTTAPPPATGTGSISGFLFWDANRNGIFDTGEDYQSSKTAFIDSDDDNILDSNEQRMITDSQGRFTFSGLGAGTYIVKRIVPKGYATTTPKQIVVLAAGQVFAGVAIGTNNA